MQACASSDQLGVLKLCSLHEMHLRCSGLQTFSRSFAAAQVVQAPPKKTGVAGPSSEQK